MFQPVVAPHQERNAVTLFQGSQSIIACHAADPLDCVGDVIRRLMITEHDDDRRLTLLLEIFHKLLQRPVSLVDQSQVFLCRYDTCCLAFNLRECQLNIEIGRFLAVTAVILHCDFKDELRSLVFANLVLLNNLVEC